jgi:hypothetical protein
MAKNEPLRKIELAPPPAPAVPALEPYTHIEQHPVVNDNGNVQYVMLHQITRFNELRRILNKNLNVNVIIPNSKGTNVHELGTGLARTNYWNDDARYTLMEANLNRLVGNLVRDYPGRISFGWVGFSRLCPNSKENPSSTLIHLWGANVNNFNYPDSYSTTAPATFGAQQANCFNTQVPGVFGIVTTPVDRVQIPLLLTRSKYNPGFSMAGGNYNLNKFKGGDPKSANKDKVLQNFKNAFNTDQFDKEYTLNGGIRPDDRIFSMIRYIHDNIAKDNLLEVLVDNFKGYMHNRIGTSLKESEMNNLVEADNLRRGELVACLDNHRWGVIVDISDDEYTVYTHNEVPGMDDNIKLIKVSYNNADLRRSTVILEQVAKPNQKLNDIDILETYTLDIKK